MVTRIVGKLSKLCDKVDQVLFPTLHSFRIPWCSCTK